MDYKTDREWSDRYLPRIKEIVAHHVITVSPFDIDTKEATDLILFGANPKRLACRLRRPGYSDKYPYDFTIRSDRLSGAKTEFEKIVNGHADLLFYGHAADDHSDMIARWFLIDLDAFRGQLILNFEKIKCEKKSNADGTEFYCFDIRSFASQPPILISSSHDIN